MKKAILAVTATAFLGLAAATPASARVTPAGFLPLTPWILILGAKEDPNFHAVNPYERKPMRRHRQGR